MDNDQVVSFQDLQVCFQAENSNNHMRMFWNFC